MTLAQEMGIEELKTACEDHAVATLSVTNACGHLATVMDLQDKPSSKLRVEFIFRLVNESGFGTFLKSVSRNKLFSSISGFSYCSTDGTTRGIYYITLL